MLYIESIKKKKEDDAVHTQSTQHLGRKGRGCFIFTATREEEGCCTLTTIAASSEGEREILFIDSYTTGCREGGKEILEDWRPADNTQGEPLQLGITCCASRAASVADQ